MANCITGAAINVVTDLVILILPLTVIWGLNIPTRSKLSLSFIFSLGSLYVVSDLMSNSNFISFR